MLFTPKDTVLSDNFRETLEKASRGRAILFCGAGASLDSIGFDLQELPAANPLLGKFNDFLGKEFSKLPIAASKVADESIKDYFRIITDCFRVKAVSDDMKTIMSYPWSRVYSTNYDNSPEIACEQTGKHYQTLTAQDRPVDLLNDRLPIIHLHGFIKHFRIDTIRDECILDYASNVANKVYEGPWATELKNDISTADIVVFLGYSLYDPEIAKLILQGGTSKKKIYFVNFRIEDEELAYMQESFGNPLNIEKSGLAQIIYMPCPLDLRQPISSMFAFDQLKILLLSIAMSITKILQTSSCLAVSKRLYCRLTPYQKAQTTSFDLQLLKM